MECLICYKVTSNHFILNSNPHLSTTIYKLLDLSATIISDNFDNSKSLTLCPECHEKLDRVDLMLGQLDELQLKLSEIRTQITVDLIKSEDLSQSDGNQLEERSKIVQELCSTIGKRECPGGVQEKDNEGVNHVNVKFDVMKNSEFYDENDEIDDFFDSQLFATNTNDDLVESNDLLINREPISLTSIPTKEVKIILERFQCPNTNDGGDSVSFNINEEPIASFILRDQENIIKTQQCRNFKSSLQKSTPKIKKRRKKGTGGFWRPPRKQKKTQADYKINFQDRVKFCSICNKHFKQPVKYREHALKHTGELPFSCDICEKRFRANGLLKAHLRTHGIGEGVIQCQICSKYLTSQKKADDHYKITHGGLKLKPYKCLEPGCTRIYSSEAALVDHNLSQHLGQKFHCTYPQCQKTYSFNNTLKAHIQSAHLQDLKYSCQEPGCDRSFRIPSKLKCHTEQIHLKIKNFKCDKCPKEFYSKYRFDRHYKINHTKDRKPYICSICSKVFYANQTLQRHLKLHLGIRDHICQYCGEEYSSMTSLKLHISRKHLGNDGHLITDTTKRRKVGRRFRVPELPNLNRENPI